MEHIIEIEGLTRKYDDFFAVDHLDLKIGKGEVFGLLGPNGAGKSTTILMMLGLTEPTSGNVRVCGLDPVHQPIEVKRKVGYLPEDVGFYDDLSGLENLTYTGQLNGLSRMEAEEKALGLLARVGLKEEKDKKAGKYSRGMRQRLGVADVLMKNPEVIILDEPTLGIDPTGVKAFLQLITDLSRKEGITVLFSSHHLYQVQQVCDRVGIFVSGRLLACGGIDSLSEQLFADESFMIEGVLDAGVRTSSLKEDLKKTKRQLQDIPGVAEVRIEEHRFMISSSKNVAPEVAAIIVGGGLHLNSLSNREYGLDEIYTRYFQE
ncbi:ABC transporter ATP-binding protein [Marinilabilia salmonicolor]|jgi:ABC-2 type transport system ATP-binding protein|uniref:ABC-2 type transport system ATP-binding protein n=1 Tax=Marinilabilia salmonicolor TaxID=989 RepID=A0A2T0XEP3_9BACT|nr:ABC transporter ATP-binding protein [Marinilabilia salmonicolor]PRY97418.1 ABC-2 type transport system ATP-binding protein [Marinilabilia salmonicolor]RCW35353.1 ABC-2 type transport system ATP-binding protein [Marinilabilia salmonicolor]